MKIAFYQPHLCLFGTTESYYKYAFYNKKILNNDSLIFYDLDHPFNNDKIIDKFKKSFETIGLQGRQNIPYLERELKNNQCDAIYIQKCGLKNDGRFVKNIPQFTHCVGCENDPHGIVYAYVSEWLSNYCSNGEFPFVPYCVEVQDHNDNFRGEFKIPSNSIVFGRLGGLYSWNINFVNDVVKKILSIRDDVYFIFAKTNKFIQHDHVIFLDEISDDYNKRKFINTSDAFLHARLEGESFGMACGEFSLCNKPVITYINSKERNHIHVLKEKGIYYSNQEDLFKILMNFNVYDNKDRNAYSIFSPDNVIKKFQKVFLDKI